MTGPKSETSPLARLILLIVCLSIAGSALAGIHYFAVDIPAQKVMHPPANSMTGVQQCLEHCRNLEGGWGLSVEGACQIACVIGNQAS